MNKDDLEVHANYFLSIAESTSPVWSLYRREDSRTGCRYKISFRLHAPLQSTSIPTTAIYIYYPFLEGRRDEYLVLPNNHLHIYAKLGTLRECLTYYHDQTDGVENNPFRSSDAIRLTDPRWWVREFKDEER